jgi:hypothetical protein
VSGAQQQLWLKMWTRPFASWSSSSAWSKSFVSLKQPSVHAWRPRAHAWRLLRANALLTTFAPPAAAAESARAAAHAAGERAALARIELIRSAAREVAAARDAAAATDAQRASAERVSADLHAAAMGTIVERAAAERVEAAAHLAAMQAAERRAGEERTTAVRDATRCAAAAAAAEEEAQVAASLLVQSRDERTGAPVTVSNVACACCLATTSQMLRLAATQCAFSTPAASLPALRTSIVRALAKSCGMHLNPQGQPCSCATPSGVLRTAMS